MVAVVQKNALKCDVCGEPLIMQSGGQMAVCECCGMQYSLDRLREKLRGQQGNVKKETEHFSSDFEIRAGVLVKYHGAGTEIVIPQGVVKEIGAFCFSNCQYVTSVALPDGLQKISSSAFSDCSSLETINIPDSVTEIGEEWVRGPVFRGCKKLKNVIISDVTFKRLCPSIREERRQAQSGVPAHSTYSWRWDAFWVGWVSSSNGRPHIGLSWDDSCSDVNKLENASPWFREILMQKQSLIEDMLRPENWKLSNLCQHCGGKFKGVFAKTCENCGRSKDY